MIQAYIAYEVEIEGVGTKKILAQSDEHALDKAYNRYKDRQPDKTKYKVSRGFLQIT